MERIFARSDLLKLRDGWPKCRPCRSCRGPKPCWWQNQGPHFFGPLVFGVPFFVQFSCHILFNQFHLFVFQFFQLCYVKIILVQLWLGLVMKLKPCLQRPNMCLAVFLKHQNLNTKPTSVSWVPEVEGC